MTASSSAQSRAAQAICCHGCGGAVERVIVALIPVTDGCALTQDKRIRLLFVPPAMNACRLALAPEAAGIEARQPSGPVGLDVRSKAAAIIG
jgi:hypothetical protein